MKESISKRGIECVGNECGRSSDTLQLVDTLEAGLGLDSLGRIELVMDLEDEFNIEIEEDRVYGNMSVAQLIAFVEKVVREGEDGDSAMRTFR